MVLKTLTVHIIQVSRILFFDFLNTTRCLHVCFIFLQGLYFIKNGIDVTNGVDKKTNPVTKKYGGGTMFIVTAVLCIVGAVTGILSTILFLKLSAKKNVDLPSMEFINPNYVN